MIKNIYERLCDKQSKDVFEARLVYVINGQTDCLTDWFLAENKELYCPELEEYEEGKGNTEYILFGAGHEGKKAYRILNVCHKKITGWSDNNRNLWGTDIEELLILLS